MTSTSPRLVLILLTLALIGCGTQDPDANGTSDNEPLTLDERIEELADCTPTDLQVLVPWTGPAFNPETGAVLEPLPAGHVEAVVNGWIKHDEAATMLRIEQATIVVMDMFASDGLLGFQSVQSLECDIAISHSLWRDEAAMFAFVTGTTHATAMSQASKMYDATGGAHWSNPERTEPPAWDEGVARYVQALRGE
jgi:heme-degrading monooxygenase HmoA